MFFNWKVINDKLSIDNKKKLISDVLFDMGIFGFFVMFLFCWSHTSLVFIYFGIILFLQLINNNEMVKRMKFWDYLKILLVFGGYISLRIIGFGFDKSVVVNVCIPLMIMVFPYFFDSVAEETKVKQIVYAIVCGACFELILSITAYFKFCSTGIIYYGDRIWPTYFFYVLTPATCYELFVIPIIALFFYAIINVRKSIFQSCFIIVAGIIAIVFLFGLVTEKGVVIIFAITLLVSLLLYLYLNRNSEWIKNILLILILTGIALSIICFLLYHFNIFSLKDYFSSYVWTRNGGIINNIRFEAQRKVYSQMLSYPFGGEKMDIGNINAVHNYWLDIYYVGGMIPFAFIGGYTVISWYDIFKLIKNCNISVETKIMLCSLYIAMFLWMSIESIVKGSVIPATIWILICQLIGVCSNEKENN